MGHCSGSVGPGDPSPFSDRAILVSSGLVQCVVEDDGGRHVLRTATAPQISRPESRVRGMGGNPPASSRSTASPFFCMLSHTPSAQLLYSTSTAPDPYPIYLWPPHLLGLQSVLQPGPPPPALRLASGRWSRPLSARLLLSVCCGVGAGGQRGPVISGKSWVASSGPSHC